MSKMYNELRTVLAERAKPETQFNIFRNIHAETINKLIKSYNVPEEEVLTTLYLSKFIMTTDVTTVSGVQQRLNDYDRVEMILKSLIESRKHIPDIDLKNRIFLLQLTWQVCWEIEKIFQRNILHNNYTLEVLFCLVIDNLLIPLLSEWYGVISKIASDSANFRWIIAEVLAALVNDFPTNLLQSLESKIHTPNITPNQFFLAGWVLCVEYFEFLQVNNYVPPKLPDPIHRHLIDPLTFCGLIIYDLNSLAVFPENNPVITTSHGNITIKETADQLIKNLISLDHPAIASMRMLHNNSKFVVSFEDNKGAKTQRFLYFYYKIDKSQNIGLWTVLLVQSEEINFKLLDTILQERLSEVQSVLNLNDPTKKVYEINWVDILHVWSQSLIVDLQDELAYRGHLEDTQKIQLYNFIGISEAIINKQDHVFAYESLQDDLRIFQTSDTSIINILNNIFSLSDLTFSIGLGLTNLLFDKFNVKIKKLKIIPSELLYYNEKNPIEQLILLADTSFEEELSAQNIITGIAFNTANGTIVHKQKTLQSRRNIQRAIHLIAESRGSKPLIQLANERLNQYFPSKLREARLTSSWSTYFKYLQDQDIGKITQKMSVKEKIQAQKEKEQQEFHTLVNNITYYLLKEIIVPMLFLKKEKIITETLNSLGNPSQVQSSMNTITRRIHSMNERITKLHTFVKNLTTELCDTKLESPIENYIEEFKIKLIEGLEKHSEADLKDILVSI